MTITNINLNSFSYEIFIGENILGKITDFTHNYDKILLLTNTTVGKIYSDSILNNLPKEKTLTFEIPDGEEYKSFETSMEIFTFLIKNNFSRKSLIICMGGGVVCDLGGFVASNFMRGIDFLQVPTSLLAQVDASIGGKVAINHPLGKNLIGAFKQPIGVIIDTNFLRTLSIEEFYSGMGEVIKHGILNDTQNYLHFLEENHENILNLNPETLEKMISISCNIKKEFVEKDEFENGERAFLNLGHTYAHALESIFNYKNISHGKAVSKGIIFEMYIAKELGYITQDYIDGFLKIFNLLKIDSHPVYFKDKTLLNAMKKDKKNSYENINFVLFTGEKFETISVDPKIICKVNSLFKNRILKGVIDIGTNSCRLFIAEIEKKDNNISIITPLYKDLEVSRLGKNLNQTGVLSEESIKKTFSIIKKFKAKTKSMGVSELVAFATSATREANNGIQFVQSLKSEFDLNTLVIPGEIEAKMSFNGNSSIYSGKIATIDVGGGSSEITIGDSSHIDYVKSFPIGVVKLTEMFFHEENYSEETINSARNYLRGFFKEINHFKDTSFKIIGVAGTVTTNVTVIKSIPTFSEESVNGYFLTRKELEDNLSLFLSKDLEERKEIIGLEPNRADVIISGNLILITLLELLNKDTIIVSTKDNLEGGMILNI